VLAPPRVEETGFIDHLSNRRLLAQSRGHSWALFARALDALALCPVLLKVTLATLDVPLHATTFGWRAWRLSHRTLAKPRSSPSRACVEKHKPSRCIQQVLSST
jgi:hypothetical protein